MLPPKVAELRTCVDAYRVSNGVRLAAHQRSTLAFVQL